MLHLYLTIRAWNPQQVINTVDLDPPRKKQFVRALIKLTRSSSCYPECVVMRDVVKNGDTPVARGGFGDVWKGVLQGHDIAIKEIRVNATDLSRILKV